MIRNLVLILTVILTLGVTACEKEEPDCHVIIRVVKNESGEIIDSYLFWSDCPDVETRN